MAVKARATITLTRVDDGAAGRDAAIISNTEPSNKKYLWCDTSVTPPLLKRYNGTVWQVVNEVDVGGRNLIRGTENWSDEAFTDVSYLPDGAVSDGVLTVPLGNTNVNTHYVDVTAEEVYTVSVDVKSVVAGSGNMLLLQYYGAEGNRDFYEFVSGRYSTEWTRISKTFTIPEGAVQFRVGLRAADNEMSYCLLQLERGNKATDWRPAPEDAYSVISDTVITLREEVNSQIDQSAETITAAVYENVYQKDDVDSLVSSVSTEVEQTKESWQVAFSQFQSDVDDIAGGNDAKFEELRKYIRFEDGNILLGNSESPLILKIRNDRIQFLQNGYEVAYISDRKMYNTVCSVIDRLEVGDSVWQVEINEDGDTVVSLIGI